MFLFILGVVIFRFVITLVLDGRPANGLPTLAFAASPGTSLLWLGASPGTLLLWLGTSPGTLLLWLGTSPGTSLLLLWLGACPGTLLCPGKLRKLLVLAATLLPIETTLCLWRHQEGRNPHITTAATAACQKL